MPHGVRNPNWCIVVVMFDGTELVYGPYGSEARARLKAAKMEEQEAFDDVTIHEMAVWY